MPREQQNAMTSWIDGSFVYSTKESWVNAMRSFENGTLTMEGDPTKGMPPLNRSVLSQIEKKIYYSPQIIQSFF